MSFLRISRHKRPKRHFFAPSNICAAILAAVVIAASGIGLVWMPYEIAGNDLLKEIVSDASDMTPTLGKYRSNFITGECEISNMRVYNSPKYDVSDKTHTATNETMLEIDRLKFRVSPLSVILRKPVVSEFEIEISRVNAVRIPNQTPNLLALMRTVADLVSVPPGGLKTLKISLKKAENGFNATYVDISQHSDIINIGRNTPVSLEKSGGVNPKTALAELSSKLNATGELSFLARIVTSYIDGEK